ncbi:LysR substrate-binding domain-containing protein [Agrobacterium tumefaciens]|uniref:LysR substrate-binding domain-containing protein n=1 Tax=Agrobacterium tumefaciens TaxID=358 RepID=UPI0029345930|nr:LysR substrate-binding domain-containing protein [Agrobacterium tumefaciens]
MSPKEQRARRSSWWGKEARCRLHGLHPRNSDLYSHAIWRDRLMVALPARYPLAVRQEVEWRQPSTETFLVRHGGTGPQVHDLIVARSAEK